MILSIDAYTLTCNVKNQRFDVRIKRSENRRGPQICVSHDSMTSGLAAEHPLVVQQSAHEI